MNALNRSRIALAVLLLTFTSVAMSVAAQADELDEYLTVQMRQLHIPGLALAVVRDGRVAALRSYGLANMEWNVPVNDDTVFELGSVTKQFTAVAVLMLVEDGKIGLDQPIKTYLPGVPATWSAVTVRHLLTHSSGIQNYLGVPGVPEAAHAAATHDDIDRIFFERLQLEFQPGETWSYSNSGYLLLGSIVEKMSGKSYWDFLSERIFQPLGMSISRNGDPKAVIPHRASGYEWARDHLENRPALTVNAYAAGSIVSTVEDMAKWDAALNTEKLLKTSSLRQAWTPLRTSSGALAPFNYGFGWFIDTYHGHRVIAHTGGTPGFSSVFYRFPDDHLSVILLTNHGDRVLDHLALDIAGLYVPTLARPREARPEPDAETTPRLKKALLGLFAGKPDPALFTPAMNVFLKTVTGQGIWPWVAADGELASFTFSEAERVGEERILRYKAIQGGATRWYSFTVTPDGKIAQIAWW